MWAKVTSERKKNSYTMPNRAFPYIAKVWWQGGFAYFVAKGGCHWQNLAFSCECNSSCNDHPWANETHILANASNYQRWYCGHPSGDVPLAKTLCIYLYIYISSNLKQTFKSGLDVYIYIMYLITIYYIYIYNYISDRLFIHVFQ